MGEFIKYGGILFAITFVVALLLGVVNYFTAPVIAENTAAAALEAVGTVIGGEIEAGSGKELPAPDTVDAVTAYTTDRGTAYAVSVSPSGYGGAIEMMVGLDADANVTGVKILSMSETAGLGANAKDNEAWLAQFQGQGGELDALTGATITSRAVESGVNAARDAVRAIEGIEGGGTNE